jgi:hypothetical protein
MILRIKIKFSTRASFLLNNLYLILIFLSELSILSNYVRLRIRFLLF